MLGRRDVGTPVGLLGALCVGLVLALLPLRLDAGAQGRVAWQPGFPMRAGNQVLLMWAPVPGAREYRIHRRDLGSGREKVWTVREPQAVDPEAPADRAYLYWVEAVLPGGVVGASSEIRKLEGFRPLEPPKWGGHYQEGRSVHLVWEAVEGAAFYNLYRAREGEEPRLLASVQGVKYVDGTVKPGATYVYTVRAVGLQSQESADSEPLRVRVTRVAGGPARARAPDRVYVEVAGIIREAPRYRLREPTDLVFLGSELLVTDMGSRSVLVLDADGALVDRIAEEPPEYEGRWGIPWGIDASPDGGRVVLTFLRSPNVRVFARDGTLLLDIEISKPKGYEDLPLVPQPMDVAVDAEGGLWVSEYTFAQVIHLDASGGELGRVGRPRPAEDSGPFRSPTFLAAHRAEGQVLVVDSLLARVFRLGRDGEILGEWSRPKAAEGALNLPKGLCVTREGDLLVVDGIRSSLQRFSVSGEIQAVFYSPDREFLDLRGLVSVAQDPRTGDIFALSKVDSAVYRLRPAGSRGAE